MPCIAIVSKMSDIERQRLAEMCGGELTLIDSSQDRDVLARDGAEVEIVYGNVRDFELPKLPKLQWVQCTWAGVENILYPAMVKRRVLITNVRGQRGRAMSEHALAGLLYLLRDFPQQHLNKQQRAWKSKLNCAMIADSKVLILGMGAIGDQLAPRLQALGASVYGVNSDGRSHPECAACYTLDGMEAILGQIDHVICCLPATPLTRAVLNAAFFDKLKAGAAFVNIARGAPVDEDALLAAVESGRLRGAVLDVTDPEPPADDSPLWQHPRILLTGHSSWAPRGDDERSAINVFCENLQLYLQGRSDEMHNLIDYDKGY